MRLKNYECPFCWSPAKDPRWVKIGSQKWIAFACLYCRKDEITYGMERIH